VGALYDICGQKNEAEDAYSKARKYGLSSRLGQSGLSLDLTEVTNRKKRKKKGHEIGASLAAYHGDSAVTHARAPIRKPSSSAATDSANAVGATAAVVDPDSNNYNDFYAGNSNYTGDGEVMTYDGSFMPMTVGSTMGGTTGGMSMMHDDDDGHLHEQHDLALASMADYESSLMVDGIGNSQF